jgi:hypothetical protein
VKIVEIKEAKEILEAGFAWASWTDEQRKAVKVAYTAMLEAEEKEYVESLENLLIFMCDSYTLILDELLELGHKEDNKAYMKVSTIQGTHNRIPIRQLGDLDFKPPKHGFNDIYKLVSDKRKSHKD